MRSIEDRFSYHAVDQSQVAAMSDVRVGIMRAGRTISETVPQPEAERALEKLEEAMMIANAGISRGPYHQAHRLRDVALSRFAVDQMIEMAKKNDILAANISDDDARALILRGL